MLCIFINRKHEMRWLEVFREQELLDIIFSRINHVFLEEQRCGIIFLITNENYTRKLPCLSKYLKGMFQIRVFFFKIKFTEE